MDIVSSFGQFSIEVISFLLLADAPSLDYQSPRHVVVLMSIGHVLLAAASFLFLCGTSATFRHEGDLNVYLRPSEVLQSVRRYGVWLSATIITFSYAIGLIIAFEITRWIILLTLPFSLGWMAQLAAPVSRKTK
ncbi:MAG: hypothetical protein AAF125_18050, partial [Chloroflexota bacterium]